VSGSPMVLVVEDNERNLKLARDLLEIHGFRVLAAGTAEEGVTLAKEAMPDLVLRNLQLPGWMASRPCGSCAVTRRRRGCGWSPLRRR
jgi:CheY-like chemotaxis protein